MSPVVAVATAGTEAPQSAGRAGSQGPGVVDVLGAWSLPSRGRGGSEVGEDGEVGEEQGPGADLGQSKAARAAAGF